MMTRCFSPVINPEGMTCVSAALILMVRSSSMMAIVWSCWMGIIKEFLSKWWEQNMVCDGLQFFYAGVTLFFLIEGPFHQLVVKAQKKTELLFRSTWCKAVFTDNMKNPLNYGRAFEENHAVQFVIFVPNEYRDDMTSSIILTANYRVINAW